MDEMYLKQPLLDGWAASEPFFDHRFGGLDRAPYRSLYLPAQPPPGYYLHPTAHLEEGLRDLPQVLPDDGLSSEEEDSRHWDIYGHVDLHKTLGQQLAVWCYRSPETVAIFTPIPGDTLSTVMSFATSNLKCDPNIDRLLLLTPGHKKPINPAEIHTARPGVAILVVPKHEFVVTLEVPQLDLKVDIVVSVTMTVRGLKAKLQREQGFPIERTDLLFRDQPMENQRHLFDYRLVHGATIFCMLHFIYDMKVTVETFWGINYDLYVDPCMTAACLLRSILRRTVSQEAGDVSTFFHLTLPRHALVLYSEDGVAMKWGRCLGKYRLDEGATFSLSTIALAHQMSVQAIPVIFQSSGQGDDKSNFLVSKFDYWSVLALKIHGVTGHPVNLMRLFCGKKELDLARVVGTFKAHKMPVIELDLSLLKLCKDILHGITFTIRLGNGVTEDLKCAPTRTIKSVKAILEDIGVPNASVYDCFVDGCKLPNNSRLGDVVEEHKKPIDLKLQSYPVFVHGPNSIIYKIIVHAKETLAVFKARVEIKTGLSESDYYMMMSGLPITNHDTTPVFRTPLSINSSIFLMASQTSHTFLLVCDKWLVKVRLPFYPQASEIKNILLKDRNVPEGSLASLGNLLQWYFAMRHASERGLMDDAIKEAGQTDVIHPQPRKPHKKWKMAKEELLNASLQQMGQLEAALNARQPRLQKGPKLQARSLPDIRSHMARNKRKKRPSYLAAYKEGKWHRINPEDIADHYLRALSLSPDVGNHSLGRQAKRYRDRPRHHSAIPDLDRKIKDVGLVGPQWVKNLRRVAREEYVESALTRAKYKKKHPRN